MSFISLSKKRSSVFPYEIGGYKINPSFRNILRIFRLLDDPDYSDFAKNTKAAEYFFEGEAPPGAFALFAEFIRRGGQGAEGGDNEKRIDFEFDADEIYASFLAEYGIDLLEDNMHWYKFLALLNALPSECALNRKIRLRFMDLKGLKGKDLAEMMRAKESVQIPERESAEEKRENEAFKEMWEKV